MRCVLENRPFRDMILMRVLSHMAEPSLARSKAHDACLSRHPRDLHRKNAAASAYGSSTGMWAHGDPTGMWVVLEVLRVCGHWKTCWMCRRKTYGRWATVLRIPG